MQQFASILICNSLMFNVRVQIRDYLNFVPCPEQPMRSSLTN